VKKLSNREMDTVLTTVSDGVLAFMDGSRPYCIPFGFVYVHNAVYLSLFPLGRKWRCMQENPEVCFTVFCWNDEHTEWSSVVIDGEIEQVSDIPTIEAVVRANIKRIGLNPELYFEKRMDYYRQSAENPKALKIFKIKNKNMEGRAMHTLIGKQ